MKVTDFHKLIKFMEMTTSDSDNESLTAIRMANKLLAANGVDWKKVFARLVTLEVEDVEPAPPEATSKESAGDAERKRERVERIEHMFETVLEKAGGGFRDWVLDVQKYFASHGYLTDGQFEALRRSYNKAQQ